MPIRCPNCGADNRDTAKFCSVCGGQMPAPQPPLQPPAVQPQPRLPAPRPPAQPPAQPSPPPPPPAKPGPPSPSPVPSMPKPGILRAGPVVDGKVTVVDQERQEKPPFDPARALVMLSAVGLMLGACAASAVFTLALWIALLIVGIGSLGCLFPVLLGPFYLLFGPLINRLRGEQTVLVLNFQALDNQTGVPVDVILYRKPGEGNVRLGDRVRVYGSVQRGSNVVRAHKIQVYESGGHPANYTIQAMKPWPIWVGLFVLGATLATIVYIGVQLGLFG